MCIRDSPIIIAGRSEDHEHDIGKHHHQPRNHQRTPHPQPCLLYTSDAADERSSVDLGGRRIIKKKTMPDLGEDRQIRKQ